MKRLNRSYCWAATGYVLLLVGIVILANLGVAPWVFTVVDRIPCGDKVGHFFLMGLFTFFLNGAFSCRTIPVFRFRLLLGSLVVCLLVFIEELSQIWLVSRTFDLYDLLFDAMGIYLFGQLALYNANASVTRLLSRK